MREKAKSGGIAQAGGGSSSALGGEKLPQTSALLIGGLKPQTSQIGLSTRQQQSDIALFKEQMGARHTLMMQQQKAASATSSGEQQQQKQQQPSPSPPLSQPQANVVMSPMAGNQFSFQFGVASSQPSASPTGAAGLRSPTIVADASSGGYSEQPQFRVRKEGSISSETKDYVIAIEPSKNTSLITNYIIFPI